MTTQAIAAPPLTIRDGLLAGLAGAVAPHLVALGVAFAAGVVLSAAGVDAASLRAPVLLLFIASSALGFRFGARG